MGLHEITWSNKYPAVFCTLGPVKEEWGDAVMAFTHQYWRTVWAYDPAYTPRLKFEISNTGYPHFHLALMFACPTPDKRPKFRMFWKKMRAMLSTTYGNHAKPPGYSHEKGYSFRLFAVPCTQHVNSKILHGGALMDHYLDEPTKEKSIDGQNFTIELDGFNAYDHIAQSDPEVREAKNKWFLKYNRLLAKGVDLPPLDMLNTIPHGCSHDHMINSWATSTLNPKNGPGTDAWKRRHSRVRITRAWYLEELTPPSGERAKGVGGKGRQK